MVPQFEHLTPDDAGQGPEDPKNYVRYALAAGIARYALEKEAGAPSPRNPLQLGIVVATDDHNGLPGNVGTRRSPWARASRFASPSPDLSRVQRLERRRRENATTAARPARA